MIYLDVILIELDSAFDWLVDCFGHFDSIIFDMFGYNFSMLDVWLAVYGVECIIELFFDWFGFIPDKDLEDFD